MTIRENKFTRKNVNFGIRENKTTRKLISAKMNLVRVYSAIFSCFHSYAKLKEKTPARTAIWIHCWNAGNCIPFINYMLKVKHKTTWAMREISSRLAMKTSERESTEILANSVKIKILNWNIPIHFPSFYNKFSSSR